MWQLYQIEVGLWLSSRTFGEYFEYEKDIANNEPPSKKRKEKFPLYQLHPTRNQLLNKQLHP